MAATPAKMKTMTTVRPALLLGPAQPDDPDFRYATGMAIETAVYLRPQNGGDLLVVPRLELERARQEASAAAILERGELGWTEQRDAFASWTDTALRLLRREGVTSVRVSPRLAAACYEGLRAAGIELSIEAQLFQRERRRKSPAEAVAIRSAQEAAEIACVEVIRHLGRASTGAGGVLELSGRPVTSERLMAVAQAALNERGHATPEMIVAGAPGCAVPHHRGSGPIQSGGPVIIDIFPRGLASGYHGDLTRTVVPGEIAPTVQRMHEACVEALRAACAGLRAGANGRDLHREACRLLVDRGYGTTTPDFEGRQEGPVLTHSLGHGVGLEVHEEPQLRNLDYELAAGDVVTVEPGLYRPGLGGVRVEDTGMVTEAGFENFTSLPYSLRPEDYL
ncbi:MAG: M24 family metallopeptidase [Candidatus Dormibacter sp.]|uniref:M24 family metallopeptidase n=1 Tax=Candidatus Dormibacter sp. TaxID=2973982 RepID=UPI003D9AB884